jgi:hypothetical protein
MQALGHAEGVESEMAQPADLEGLFEQHPADIEFFQRRDRHEERSSGRGSRGSTATGD